MQLTDNGYQFVFRHLLAFLSRYFASPWNFHRKTLYTCIFPSCLSSMPWVVLNQNKITRLINLPLRYSYHSRRSLSSLISKKKKKRENLINNLFLSSHILHHDKCTSLGKLSKINACHNPTQQGSLQYPK